VSVNISARNLETPGFPDLVGELLAEFGLPAATLLLEVTETALAGDAERAAEAVRDLAGRGIGISVDDFGMGYTSLSQLRGLRSANSRSTARSSPTCSPSRRAGPSCVR